MSVSTGNVVRVSAMIPAAFERILFLLVEFCRNVPGILCRVCVDAGCRLECCFCRLELLEACVYCRGLVAGFCHVECLDAWGTLVGGCLLSVCMG